MKRFKVTFVSVFALLIFIAIANVSRAQEGSVTTDALPSIPEDSSAAIDPRNLIYKKRLDSIQRSIPLTYNSYVQEYLDLYIARKNHIGKMLGLSKFYFPVYEKALKQYNVPDELKYLSIVESSLDPMAISRSGAIGLWQFMYTTASGYGLKMDNYVDERRDPVASSYAAAHYFRNAFDKFGDWLLAIAAYNCGEGAVERAMIKAGGVKDFWQIREFLPQQTRNYVPAYIATTYMMRFFESHDIQPAPSFLPELLDIIQVNKFVSLNDIANVIGMEVKDLAALNPAYKKQVINGSTDAPKSLVMPAINGKVYESLYTVLNSSDEKLRVSVVETKRNSRAEEKKTLYHKVKNGENLSVIANRYHVEVEDLKAWNKLKTLTVVPGQRLKISLSGPV